MPSVKSIDLSIDFFPIKPVTTISTYIKGDVQDNAQDKLLKTAELDESGQYHISVPLSGKLTLLRFHTIEGTIKPKNDTREIAVGVRAIKVDVN